MFNSKISKILGIGALAALCVTGAFAAFYGITATSENNYNIVAGESGAEAGTITEPSWNEENAVDLEPGADVDKDPYVTVTADYDGYVFVEVSVPTIYAMLEGDEDYTVYDTFTLTGVDEDNWTLVESTVSSEAGTASVYVYGYNEVVESGESTTSLFTSITEQDFIAVAAGSEDGDMNYGTNLNGETVDAYSYLTGSVDLTGTIVQATNNDFASAAEAAGYTYAG